MLSFFNISGGASSSSPPSSEEDFILIDEDDLDLPQGVAPSANTRQFAELRKVAKKGLELSEGLPSVAPIFAALQAAAKLCAAKYDTMSNIQRVPVMAALVRPLSMIVVMCDQADIPGLSGEAGSILRAAPPEHPIHGIGTLGGRARALLNYAAAELHRSIAADDPNPTI